MNKQDVYEWMLDHAGQFVEMDDYGEIHLDIDALADEAMAKFGDKVEIPNEVSWGDEPDDSELRVDFFASIAAMVEEAYY